VKSNADQKSFQMKGNTMGLHPQTQNVFAMELEKILLNGSVSKVKNDKNEL